MALRSVVHLVGPRGDSGSPTSLQPTAAQSDSTAARSAYLTAIMDNAPWGNRARIAVLPNQGGGLLVERLASNTWTSTGSSAAPEGPFVAGINGTELGWGGGAPLTTIHEVAIVARGVDTTYPAVIALRGARPTGAPTSRTTQRQIVPGAIQLALITEWPVAPGNTGKFQQIEPRVDDVVGGQDYTWSSPSADVGLDYASFSLSTTDLAQFEAALALVPRAVAEQIMASGMVIEAMSGSTTGLELTCPEPTNYGGATSSPLSGGLRGQYQMTYNTCSIYACDAGDFASGNPGYGVTLHEVGHAIDTAWTNGAQRNDSVASIGAFPLTVGGTTAYVWKLSDHPAWTAVFNAAVATGTQTYQKQSTHECFAEWAYAFLKGGTTYLGQLGDTTTQNAARTFFQAAGII